MKTRIAVLLGVILSSFVIKAENEPNNVTQQANILLYNGQESGSLSDTDYEDWFVVTLPEGGVFTLKINKSGSGNGILYFHDGESAGNPQLGSTGLNYGDSPAGGWDLSLPLLHGKYYIRIFRYNEPLSYTLTASLATPAFGEDPEPNDSVQHSVSIPHNAPAGGTLHYYGPGRGKDLRDWFKTDIPQAGILNLSIHKKGAGNTTLYFRDENLATGKALSNYYLHYGDSPAEGYSWNFPVLAGSYWFLLEGGDGLVDYRLEPGLVSPSWTEDQEPNDSMKVALDFPLNDSVSGLVYYHKPGIGRDESDWYAITTTEYGQLSFEVSKKGIYGSVSLKDQEKDILNQPFAYEDRVYFFSRILPAGTYYLVFKHSSNWMQYKASVKFMPKPEAEFTGIRTENAIAFRNETTFGESYTWNFDDGTSSAAVNPLHSYENPGDYDVCLIAKNVVGSDTICQRHIVPGIDRFSPAEGGNTGDLTLDVFGGGLDTTYQARIMDGDNLIAASFATFDSGKGSVQVRFDLREKPVGIYDMIIEKPGGPSYLLPESFSIVKGTKPDPWVSISGRNRMLFNTWSNYTINYGNNGNVDAVMTPVCLAFSRASGLDVELSDMEIVDPESESGLLTDEIIYADENTILDEPKPVRFFPIHIPVIPANSQKSFNIRIKTSEDLEVICWAANPWFQSPMNPLVTGCLAGVMADFNVISQIPLNDLECFLMMFDSFYNKMARFLLTRNTQSSKPLSSKKVRVVSFYAALNYAIKSCDIDPDDKEYIKSLLFGLWLHNNIADKSKTTKSISTSPDYSACEVVFDPLNLQVRTIRAVSSIDPNEKAGLTGFGEENYISCNRSIPYTIHFENMASATAPAHTVTIYDQLDTTKFDLASFSFSDVRIGDSIIYVPSGLKELVIDKKLDNRNVVARIHAKCDVGNGVLEWKIRSLDPVTFEDIDDPDAGLLPPNIVSPEGQGSVSFFVKLKNEPVHKEQIENEARIVFDSNPPIFTNRHLATFDLEPPQSAVHVLPAMTSDKQFLVEWSGTDDASGIDRYDIYVSKNDSAFQLWLGGKTDNSATFTSDSDGAYKFVSIASDKTGNREIPDDVHDAEINVVTNSDDPEMPESIVRVFPNPVKKLLMVQINLPGRYLFKIFSPDGRLILEKVLDGNSPETFNLDNRSNGLYFYQVEGMKTSFAGTGKFVLGD